MASQPELTRRDTFDLEDFLSPEDFTLQQTDLEGDLEEFVAELFKTTSVTEQGLLLESLQGEADAQPVLRKTRSGNCFPTIEDPDVSMLAFVGQLGNCVNLAALAEHQEVATFTAGKRAGIVGLKYQPPDGGDMVAKGLVKTSSKKAFARQLTLVMAPNGKPNVSVKVFNTGALQIAGCADHSACNRVMQCLIESINKLQSAVTPKVLLIRDGGVLVPYDGLLELSSMEPPHIVNVNCTFDSGYDRLGYHINATVLAEILQTRPAYQSIVKNVEYSPEQKYAGVKIKFIPLKPLAVDGRSTTREVFIGVFPSGKVVLTGAVNETEVKDGWQFIRDVLYSNYELLRLPRPLNGRKRSRATSRRTAALSSSAAVFKSESFDATFAAGAGAASAKSEL